MMNIVPIKRLPPSQPGQLLRERPRADNTIRREMVSKCVDPRGLVSPGTSNWTARYGGWVRLVS